MWFVKKGWLNTASGGCSPSAVGCEFDMATSCAIGHCLCGMESVVPAIFTCWRGVGLVAIQDANNRPALGRSGWLAAIRQRSLALITLARTRRDWLI
eukprot:1793295-Rhodomonas_salina.3